MIAFLLALAFAFFLFAMACEAQYGKPKLKPQPPPVTIESVWETLEKAQRTVDVSLDLVQGRLECAPGYSPFPSR